MTVKLWMNLSIAKNRKEYLVRSLQKGFSMTEMMTAMSIISILTSMAMPVYSDYLVRTRVVELLAVASAAREAVWDKFAADGFSSFGSGYSGVYNFGGSTKNFSSASIGDSFPQIVVRGTDATHETYLILTPTATGSGTLQWECSTDDPARRRYVPVNCRG
jgi:type IV pilus assembly protein PilA